MATEQSGRQANEERRQRIQRTVDAARRERDDKYEREMFQPGKLVMLHCFATMADGKLHPDCGRIGRVVSCEHGADGKPKPRATMVVEFWSDELVGSGTYCLLPRDAWFPVPDFVAEEYQPRAKKRGWRVSERGLRIFTSMNWPHTAATRGEA